MPLNRILQHLILAALLLTGCSSATLINSEPQGAQVFVDGELKGTTPYTYSDRKTIGSTTNILLKKEGYEDYNMLLIRNEEFDAAACAGGVFTLIPFLWVQKYSPERTLELTGLDGTDEIDTSPEPTPTPEPTAAPAATETKPGLKVKVAPVKTKPAPKAKPAKAPKGKKGATKPATTAPAAKPVTNTPPADAPAAAPSSEAPKQ